MNKQKKNSAQQTAQTHPNTTNDPHPPDILQERPYSIEEKNGTILTKRNFDLVFHLVPLENDILKNKITDRFGIIDIPSTFCKIDKTHYAT